MIQVETEIPGKNMPVSVSGLSQIPVGQYSLGVPIRDGRVQVGFRGIPDSFDRLRLNVGPGTIRIVREGGDIQIESDILNKEHEGRATLIRTQVLVEPEPEITFRETKGKWTTDGRKVASRLGFARFSAKVAEAAIGKARRAQLHKG